MELIKNKWVLVIAIITIVTIFAWLENAPRPAGWEVTAAELKTNLPKMVELYTPNCSSCRAMDPMLRELKVKCEKNGVTVDKIDVSKSHNEHLVEEFDLMAVPTFVFINEDGIVHSQLVGRQSESTLEEHLAAAGGRCSDS